MFAYFIGGPIDLTKRATKQEPGTWMVPVRTPITLTDKGPNDKPVYQWKHEYRLMFREEDVLIYIYQGIR